MRNKSLLVLFNTGLLDERAIKQKMYWLNQILLITESTDQFCRVTELVDRNRITSNKKRIIKETANFRLKPFRFLINKN
jgi:hypothetical protein